MKVCLVHHADAVGPDVDPQRPLSELGRRQADWLARVVKNEGFVPAAIWHSGKLRSRQTAEAFLHGCAPFAEFKMIRGLRSEDPPEWLRDELAVESRDILLVGHRPHIDHLVRMLAPGTDLPMNGLAGLERLDDGSWKTWAVSALQDREGPRS